MSAVRPQPRERIGVIIVAAGHSQRMEGIDKVFALIGNKPLLAWSIAPFEASPLVDEIVIAVHRTRIQDGRRLVSDAGLQKVSQICRGGERRQDSVREALWRMGKCDWVLVHDGARPGATAELIGQGIEAARETGVAVPGIPIRDTVKRANNAGIVEQTLERKGLYAIQTPQVFRYNILWAAHQAEAPDVTDDAALVERLGYAVKVFPGLQQNIKVTTQEDLNAVGAFLSKGTPV